MWRVEWNIRQVIGFCEISLSLDLADVESRSVQAMAKCSQAINSGYEQVRLLGTTFRGQKANTRVI